MQPPLALPSCRCLDNVVALSLAQTLSPQGLALAAPSGKSWGAGGVLGCIMQCGCTPGPPPPQNMHEPVAPVQSRDPPRDPQTIPRDLGGTLGRGHGEGGAHIAPHQHTTWRGISKDPPLL